MKKLIILLPLFMLLTACEIRNDWKVTTTLEIQYWNTVSVKKYKTDYVVTEEIVVDMDLRGIKRYCKPEYYTEQYGTTLYKYFTTRTYEAIE